MPLLLFPYIAPLLDMMRMVRLSGACWEHLYLMFIIFLLEHEQMPSPPHLITYDAEDKCLYLQIFLDRA